jgi:predicted CoA-binding protein
MLSLFLKFVTITAYNPSIMTVYVRSMRRSVFPLSTMMALLTSPRLSSTSAFSLHTTVKSSNHQRRNLAVMASGDTKGFFSLEQFAVVGASIDQEKFGNKVLRCYAKHGYSVVPINKRVSTIEGMGCSPSLTSWVASTTATSSNITPSRLGVSIVTPPGVTKLIIEEGYSLGVRWFFLQPGTHDKITDEWLRSDAVPDANIVTGCVLVELGWP